MSDLINHPPHYATALPGIRGECIEYSRHMTFSQGNAFKYVWRAGAKGDGRQDLDKAAWYLNDAATNGPMVCAGVPILIDFNAPQTRRRYLLACIARGDMARASQLLAAITDPAQLNEEMR